MKIALQRTTWLKIHLYLAFIIGFFFALMRLTGSVSVYREAIDEFLNLQLVIENHGGRIKEVRNPATFSTGEKIMEWLWSLHTGETLGAMGRLAWFFKGFALCFLYATGVMHWLYRQGKIQDRAVDISALRPLLD